jgi:hypothetical protein
MLICYRLLDIALFILWRIATQRLGKYACNTHVANNTAEELFSMWSAPKFFARQLRGNMLLQQQEKTVFSLDSDPRLYNEGLFVGSSSRNRIAELGRVLETRQSKVI